MEERLVGLACGCAVSVRCVMGRACWHTPLHAIGRCECLISLCTTTNA